MAILKDFLPDDDVEYYRSAEDFLVEEDRIETDMRMVGWKGKLRIRALDLGQQMDINQKSLNDKGELQEDEFIYWTVVHGVVRPKFTHVQATKLREKNGEYVKTLSDEIWAIGRVSKTFFDAYIEEQKKARDDTKT